MLSEGNNEVTVGATYEWNGFEKGPTDEKRKELEQHIRCMGRVHLKPKNN